MPIQKLPRLARLNVTSKTTKAAVPSTTAKSVSTPLFPISNPANVSLSEKQRGSKGGRPIRWTKLNDTGRFNAPAFNHLTPLSGVDSATKAWIRNATDERAAQSGFRFSEKRGQYTVDWVERYCTLYEGDRAGFKIDIDDWQYEYFMQLFGWMVFDDERNRWVRRFRSAGVWIPKKNAKSPTLAATGLYMLIGDGEPGQKCYSVARDGKQAMISHRHAMEMVRASEELNDECKINNQTGVISHIPSRSEFYVCYDNPESTEGYNGSIFIDETHVVNEKLIKRISRAGISRAEPLHIEMSTAGDDGDSYGFGRFIYGLSIESGEKYDPRFYFRNFSVSRDTPQEHLNDRIKVEASAIDVNPALGRIVFKSELMTDYDESTTSLKKLLDFARYRLNFWASTGDVWIPKFDWMACRDTKGYTLDELRQYPCVVGLDLSITTDLTALIACFAVPDKQHGVRPFYWPWFWMPEETVKRYATQPERDFRRFGKDLTIIPGKVIQYELIVQHLLWLQDNFDLHALGYDPYNMGDVLRCLINEHGWSETMLFAIKQQMPYMGPPAKEFERLILMQGCSHNGNSCMAWQFEHCQVITDVNQNVRPVKPDAKDHKKVDGIVGGVMATAMFFNDETIRDGYSPGILIMPQQNDEEPKVPWTNFMRRAETAGME